MKLSDILKATAKRMEADFDGVTAGLGSSVQKGTAREDVVREFLKLYLSLRFGAERGELADCEGNLTGELDVIVYDRDDAPPLFSSPNTRVIPCEAARAVVEVKSRLDPAGVREDAAKIQRAKSLSRRLLEPVLHMPLEGLEREDWPPVLGGIFAFESSVGLGRLGDELSQWNASAQAHERVDFILVLRRGLVAFGADDPDWPAFLRPSADLGLTLFQQETEPPRVLLMLTSYIHLRLAEFDGFAGRPSPLPFHPYLQQALKELG